MVKPESFAAHSMPLSQKGMRPAAGVREVGLRKMGQYRTNTAARAGRRRLAACTMRNVAESDGTLVIYSGQLRGGTAFTAEQCTLQQKPVPMIDAEATESARAAETAEQFVRGHGIGALNVAGPRKSEEPRGYDYTYALITDLLRRPV